jgi:2'-5' RNA ligase
VPRLFVAVELPDRVKEELAQIRWGLPNARWLEPEQIHLTLRFIGEVDGGQFLDIQSALSSIRQEPFDIALAEAGFFPLRKKPESLWIGIERSEMLLRLKSRIDTALAPAGVPQEGRKFLPHVTIARLQNSPDKRVAEFLAAVSSIVIGPFPIEAFSLYSSNLLSSGAVHVKETEYTLL